MRVNDTLNLPTPMPSALRAGDGGGTMLTTLPARTALSLAGRSRGVLATSGDGPPLQGEVLSRPRIDPTDVESYLALGGVAPPATVPRSIFVDLYA